MKKIEIFNDPVYGFIYIHNELIYNIIKTPYFQRLRRITQMGLSYLVYPGAHHTRFHHALGCTFLMQKAIDTLRLKNIEITKSEEEALHIAILLHDIGHGPFSHALENTIVKGISHEDISLLIMEELNKQYEGKLDLAIAIFKNEHPKMFFNQLISSQLDMDRLDYLNRDSFYTGVTEGSINAQRLISMLNVKDNELVIDEKGIYSVEKFIVARRMMYWLVYLHKTSLAAENVLIKTLERAKELIKDGVQIDGSRALLYFLKNDIEKENLDEKTLNFFSQIDDYDILSALKLWSNHDDLILSSLSNSIINRNLPKVKMQNESISTDFYNKKFKETQDVFSLNQKDTNYFVFKGSVSNTAYNSVNKGICILMKTGEVKDISIASDQLNVQSLSKSVTKYFICYPKGQLS